MTLFILIGILFSVLSQEKTVVNCTYDEPEVRAQCAMPTGTRIVPISWSDEAFAEWLYQAQLRGGEVDYNLPLVKTRPKHGAILKVELQEDGEWIALAGCHVRVQRKLHERAKQRPGEIPSFTLLEQPADCQKKVEED